MTEDDRALLRRAADALLAITCDPDDLDDARALRRLAEVDHFGRLKLAILNAQLPRGYRWGSEAMEQFNYGKLRAAVAFEEAYKRLT